VAADDATFVPKPASATENAALPIDVALLMDLPDDRPEACGITLLSHVTLWHAVQRTVAERIDDYHDDLAGELFDIGQGPSETSIREAAVREHFLNLLRTRIAPATITRCSAQRLTAEGFRVSAWGSNWGLVHPGNEFSRGEIPVGGSLNDVFHSASVIVFPSFSRESLQMALDALCTGAAVVCYAPSVPFANEYPGLAALAPYLHFYRRSLELIEHLRFLTSRSEARREVCRAARALVQADHSVARRLLWIVDRLRERQASAMNG
jgi:hypothetical protein